MIRDYLNTLATGPAEVTVLLDDGLPVRRTLTVHPLALLIPGMSDEDLARLRADIQARGVNEPLVLFEGKVLDGRHRLAIASQSGRPVRTRLFEGDEAAARAYVWSANIARRHLTIPQLALAADRFGFIAAAKAEAGPGNRAGASWPAIASRKVGGTVTPKTLRRFDAGQVAAAPRTVSRIESGQLRRVDTAVQEAAAELGIGLAPPVHRSPWDRLGCARGDVLAAERSIIYGDRGTITAVQFSARAREIQQALIRIEGLLR